MSLQSADSFSLAGPVAAILLLAAISGCTDGSHDRKEIPAHSCIGGSNGDSPWAQEIRLDATNDSTQVHLVVHRVEEGAATAFLAQHETGDGRRTETEAIASERLLAWKGQVVRLANGQEHFGVVDVVSLPYETIFEVPTDKRLRLNVLATEGAFIDFVTDGGVEATCNQYVEINQNRAIEHVNTQNRDHANDSYGVELGGRSFWLTGCIIRDGHRPVSAEEVAVTVYAPVDAEGFTSRYSFSGGPAALQADVPYGICNQNLGRMQPSVGGEARFEGSTPGADITFIWLVAQGERPNGAQ